MKLLLTSILLAISSAALAGPSVYETMPGDPAAVVVKAIGDGRADDSAAIQAAIDLAANDGAGGIVFLPSGRYRISRTLLVRPAVRIFGVGKTRPVNCTRALTWIATVNTSRLRVQTAARKPASSRPRFRASLATFRMASR